MLNELASTLKAVGGFRANSGAAPPGNAEILTRAEALLREAFPSLDFPFRQPELELLGIVAGIGQTNSLCQVPISSAISTGGTAGANSHR